MKLLYEVMLVWRMMHIDSVLYDLKSISKSSDDRIWPIEALWVFWAKRTNEGCVGIYTVCISTSTYKYHIRMYMYIRGRVRTTEYNNTQYINYYY